MKKLFTSLSLGLAFMNGFSQSLDLAPSNLGSNIYFDNYNEQTKTLEGIHFMILENDGNNSQDVVPDFTVKLYVYKNANEYYFIKTFNVTNFHEISARTFGDYDNGQPRIDIDLSTISAITSGTYKLGVYVDADEEISESNENNNAILFSDNGSFDYTTGPVQTNKADLSIVGKSYTFDDADDNLKDFKVSVKNNGNVSSTSAKIKITVTQSGSMTGDMTNTQSIGIIAPGSTQEITLNNVDLSQLFGFDPNNPNNSYKFVITVDSDNQIDESNENNNTLTEDPINFSGATALVAVKEEFGIQLPNPVSNDYLAGLSKTPGIQSVKVYAVTGALMNVNNLPSGMYIVKIDTANGSVTKRMLVE
ncbi:MAG: CARDB domain-containing protein [Flavobacteriales bacterium]